MKNRMISSALFILFACLIPQSSQPCTSFCLDHGSQPVFGTNLDLNLDDGLVIVNKRGLRKTAMSGSSKTFNPAIWTSKYGSVTFNLYGRELPWGGMNEAGLVVSTMILTETEYPAPDPRPSIVAAQWKQYLLDNFSTVEEVIASDSQVRIRASKSPGCHNLVCDKSGNCAIIEFLGGKLLCHTKETLPLKTLTNTRYAQCIEFWKQGWSAVADSYGSVDRFVRAAYMVRNYDPKTSKSAIAYAFDILRNVAQGMRTQWSIVYDIKNLRIYFRTRRNQEIRQVDLNSFDFSCITPVKVLDINAELSGDVTDSFVDYTRQINRNLIRNTFRKSYFLTDVPEESLDKLARYPESTACTH